MEDYSEMINYPFLGDRLYKVVRTDQLDRFFPECPNNGYRPIGLNFAETYKKNEQWYVSLKEYRGAGQFVSFCSILAWSSSQVWKMRSGDGREAVYHVSELEVVKENSDESDC